MNKKGIELSANFMVVILLSVVVFAMGIYLVNMFFASSEDIKEDINRQTEEQIISLLMTGDRVSIPITKESIKKGKSYTFGVGILNVLGKESDFVIETSSGPVVFDDGTSQNPPSDDIALNFLETKTFRLKNNEHQVVGLPIAVPGEAVKGAEYIINVKVCNSTSCPYNAKTDDLYDKAIHKIRVRVI